MNRLLLVLIGAALCAGCSNENRKANQDAGSTHKKEARTLREWGAKLVFSRTDNQDLPSVVQRPKDMPWGGLTNGLQMATWTVPDQPFVFCLIRNGAKEPISVDSGPGGLGWWEWTRILSRPARAVDWAAAPCNRNWVHLGAYQPNPKTLEPGLEITGGDRNYTFAVDLRDYTFPSQVEGILELRIEHHGISGSIMKVDTKAFREKANNRMDSDKQ